MAIDADLPDAPGVIRYDFADMALKKNRAIAFTVALLSFGSVPLVPVAAFAAPRVPTHVACVGDSITYGYGASNQATKSYPAVLQTLFGSGVQVKNFGRNSATMLSAPYGDLPYKDQAEYTAAGSFVSGAGANALTYVVILLGANDSKNYNWAPGGKPKNDQQYLKDYRAMVEHFSGLTPKPLVFLGLPLATGNNPCCSIDGKVIHDEMVPLIKQLATEKNLPTIDLNTPTTGHPEYFGDGVHPTDAGYAIVAGLVHDGLLIDQGSAGASGAGAAGGTSGNGGTSGTSGTSAGGGTGGTGAATSAGSGGLVTAGAAGSAQGGAGSANAGASGTAPNAAGAQSSAAAGSGGTGANAGAGVKSSPPPTTDAGGCALGGSRAGVISAPAIALLGLSLLGVRRRRVRR